MSSPKTASRHLALHAASLGVERWRLGVHGQDTALAAQAGWHAAAQQHFMDWLAGGGFRQQEAGEMDSTNENSGCYAAVLMSRCGTQCEELKFSRVRISDAVE
ncbi:hypothetical protein [Pseudoduganella aquatica]|uniref:Uncharacterized protein n=1 Tax=Pseudoduganella aquatica TaxID=2660641 RepID=A0A7X4HEG9_9BURK|nr:hypothetical protein [Pseudoduganella aquatica]MYN09484.1 hypothetical protein [Pseudoduganella aquatica]